MQIYKIFNLLNEKIYIGQDSKDRKDYYGSGVLIMKAIKKYGKKNFQKDILQNCKTKKELNECEMFWIEFFESNKRNKGYNLTKGGEGTQGAIPWNKGLTKDNNDKMKIVSIKNSGKKMTKEQCKKLSIAKKGKKIDRSKIVYTPEWRKILSDAHIGNKPTLEDRMKRSKTMKLKIWVNKDGKDKRINKSEKETYLNNGWHKGRANFIGGYTKGIKHTIEHKEKIRQGQLAFRLQQRLCRDFT